MQSSTSRELCGEIKLNAAIATLNISSIPGFSIERFKYHYRQAAKVNWIATLQAGPPYISITFQQLAKKKRNLRTRNQKKKKAQAQTSLHVTVQVQEVDHNQEEEHLLIAWNKPSKHVILKQLVQWDRMCTSLHVVIQSDRMTMVAGMMIDYGVNQIRRLGVG